MTVMDYNGNNKWELEREKQRNVCRIFQQSVEKERVREKMFQLFHLQEI
jgi:hypothetical protein